ncbi:hypothetical protein GOQ04_25310, partial [Emticicia sp. ODNR4P]|nr:hypothetical protein [Emticicia sp. ODNR4P]
NGKTKVGQAISNIWGGIKGIFTGKTQNPVSANGTTLQVKDNQGNVIAQKETNTNWGGVLAGVGLLFTSIFPNAINQDSNLNNQQPDPNVQQQQLQRTGQNILWVVGLAIVGIGTAIIIYFKKKDD